MADFVQAIAQPPGLNWIVGTITAVTGYTVTVNCFGGDVEDVAVLDQYTPLVGDVVHMLSMEPVGMLVIGSLNTLATPRPEPPTTGTEAILTPIVNATYGPLPGQWELGTVVQDTDRVGCFFYDPLGFSPVAVADLATVSIELTLDSGTGPPEFVELTNSSAQGLLTVLTEIPFGVQPGPVGTPTWLDLPLDWGTDLITGAAGGIGIASSLFTGVYTSSTGRLRLTPVS